METPQITTSSSCLQQVKSRSNENTRVGNKGGNFWLSSDKMDEFSQSCFTSYLSSPPMKWEEDDVQLKRAVVDVAMATRLLWMEPGTSISWSFGSQFSPSPKEDIKRDENLLLLFVRQFSGMKNPLTLRRAAALDRFKKKMKACTATWKHKWHPFRISSASFIFLRSHSELQPLDSLEALAFH